MAARKKKSIALNKNTRKLLEQLDPQHGGIKKRKKSTTRKKK